MECKPHLVWLPVQGLGLGPLVPAFTETRREKLVIPSTEKVTFPPFLVISFVLTAAFLEAQRAYVGLGNRIVSAVKVFTWCRVFPRGGRALGPGDANGLRPCGPNERAAPGATRADSLTVGGICVGAVSGQRPGRLGVTRCQSPGARSGPPVATDPRGLAVRRGDLWRAQHLQCREGASLARLPSNGDRAPAQPHRVGRGGEQTFTLSF